MDYDVIIIGAGCVGLACAMEFSRLNKKALVVEKESRIGTGVSSRNSEVIHAGIYYPKGSLKSELCIEGKNLLYDYCSKKNISCKRTGKFIVATTSEELNELEKIKKNAEEAGMRDLFFKTKKEIENEEPEVYCVGGLYSPTSGILSAHELMDSLKSDAENKGADFLFKSQVEKIEKIKSTDSYKVLIYDNDGELVEVETYAIINCSGLYSDLVAKKLGVYKNEYELTFVKGNYFKLIGAKLNVKRLIYPVPLKNLKSLGIHVVIGIDGSIKLGPDAEDMNERVEDYKVNESRKVPFFESVKKYLPKIKLENLEPDMSGIRPKLKYPEGFKDFIIQNEIELGFANFINCIGIESPGLTSCLAIAKKISYILNFY
jgi:L-2-hydroxyglutarate oxidase LhgO